jgi:hypothetical protein
METTVESQQHPAPPPPPADRFVSDEYLPAKSTVALILAAMAVSSAIGWFWGRL